MSSQQSSQQNIGSDLLQASAPAQQATKRIGNKLNELRLERARRNIQKRKSDFKKAQEERKAKMDKIKEDIRKNRDERLNPKPTPQQEEPQLPEEDEVRNIQNRILDNLREQVRQQQEPDEQSITQQQKPEQEGQPEQTQFKPSDEDITENTPTNQPSLENEEVDITKSATQAEKDASTVSKVVGGLDEASADIEATSAENPVSDIVGGLLALGGAIYSQIAPDKSPEKPPPQPTIQETTQFQSLEV